MTTSTFFIIFATMAISAVLFLQAHSLYLPKRANQLNTKDGLMDPKKRPFCNAFTGCGRKRSNIPAISNHGVEAEESLGSLLELSAEPAVEDLSRQIMSEAKLWEAIQEANMELSRRRQESAESSEEDVGVPAKAVAPSCDLPPCYIAIN